MATVHLLYGLAGSGKTTFARRLEAERPALRFTLDEWMIRLYPDLDIHGADYGLRAKDVRELIWDLAAHSLRAGTDAVLDWNFWSIERRRWAIDRARLARAGVELHWLTETADVATARARQRAENGTGYFHEITAEDNQHLASLMEAPSESEGLIVRRVVRPP